MMPKISFVGVLAALLALSTVGFSACSPQELPESSQSQTQTSPESPQAPQTPQTPDENASGVIIGTPIEIPAEKEREIILAWLDEYPKDDLSEDDLSLDVRGVFGDTYVYYLCGPFGASDVITKALVGNVLFEYPSSLTLDVYCNGDFYSLGAAYGQGLLDRDDLLTLQKNYNNGWYWSMSQTIKGDYAREYDDVKIEELSLRVYYLCGLNDAVLFVDGGGDYPAVETQQEVDGVLFEYPTAQQLLYYGAYSEEKDSMFCDLNTAFARGLLNHANLLAILSNYEDGVTIAIP